MVTEGIGEEAKILSSYNYVASGTIQTGSKHRTRNKNFWGAVGRNNDKNRI